MNMFGLHEEGNGFVGQIKKLCCTVLGCVTHGDDCCPMNF